jgi:phosphatidylserine decarboxylase
MWLFAISEFLSGVLLWLLPRRLSSRIKENMADVEVTTLSTMQIKTIPRMTLFEAVGATILFDLALFGTKNWFINSVIRLFTSIQNSWDTPFVDGDAARDAINEFTQRLSIQQKPWIWEKRIEEYVSLNDFFSRTFAPEYLPRLGSASVVSPASCTLRCYRDNQGLKELLIKGCNYQLEKIGIPYSNDYANNAVLIGYLSPSDYHRVHAPMAGTIVHLSLQDELAQSASVKFFDSKFNLLNENKRLVAVIEDTATVSTSTTCPKGVMTRRLALVIVGGVGVNTIVYDKENLWNKAIEKGACIATFLAGGSAIAVFSNQPLTFTPEFETISAGTKLVQVNVGESLANF